MTNSNDSTFRLSDELQERADQVAAQLRTREEEVSAREVDLRNRMIRQETLEAKRNQEIQDRLVGKPCADDPRLHFERERRRRRDRGIHRPRSLVVAHLSIRLYDR